MLLLSPSTSLTVTAATLSSSAAAAPGSTKKVAGGMGTEKQGGFGRSFGERFRRCSLSVAGGRPLRRRRLLGKALFDGLQESNG